MELNKAIIGRCSTKVKKQLTNDYNIGPKSAPMIREPILSQKEENFSCMDD